MKKASVPISIAVLLAVLFSASFVPMSVAMGAPPGSCKNEYDGAITTFKINPYPGVVLNPANVAGGLTIELLNTNSYKAVMTITTPGQSSHGNANRGQQWWNSNIFGYYSGACTSLVEPSEKIKLATNVGMAAPLDPKTPETYTTVWSTFYGRTISYNVYWVPSPNNDVFIGVANYALKVSPGYTVNTRIYVASVQNFAGTIKLSWGGPPGLKITANPSIVNLRAGGVATSTLSVGASTSLSRGETFMIEVTDTGAHCVICTDDISVKII